MFSIVSRLFGHVHRLDARIGGERHLLDVIERVGAPRHLDVVRDERALADELVGTHDEVRHVPAEDPDEEVADRRRRDGDRERGQLGAHHRAHCRDDGADDERDGDHEHADDADVGVGIGDAGEDRMVGKDALVASQEHLHGQGEQHAGERRAHAAQQIAGCVQAPPALEDARAPGKHREDAGRAERHHAQRHQPTGEELPDRQREQVEDQRPREDRIGGAAGGGRRAEPIETAAPVERERAPRRRHRQPGDERDGRGDADADQPNDRLHRQADRLTVDENRPAAELAEARRLQHQEDEIQDQEGDGREPEKDPGPQVERRPEDGREAERVEPERLDVVRQGRPAAEKNARRGWRE